MSSQPLVLFSEHEAAEALKEGLSVSGGRVELPCPVCRWTQPPPPQPKLSLYLPCSVSAPPSHPSENKSRLDPAFVKAQADCTCAGVWLFSFLPEGEESCHKDPPGSLAGWLLPFTCRGEARPQSLSPQALFNGWTIKWPTASSTNPLALPAVSAVKPGRGEGAPGRPTPLPVWKARSVSPCCVFAS